MAHYECKGANGELGEGLVRSCGRRRSRGRGGEDGGAEGDAGRPASGGSVRRRTGTRRSSWAAPGGEGEAVASTTAAAAYGRVGRSGRGRGKGQRRGEWCPGGRGGAKEKTRGVAVARRRGQAAWCRGARTRTVRCPSSAYWQRLGMTGTRPGGLGQHR